MDWEPLTTSTCVESGSKTLVLDPQAPPPGAVKVWERLDARPPTAIVVLKPDHVRDSDLFVRRYGPRTLGPGLFLRDDVPETILEPIELGWQPASERVIALARGGVMRNNRNAEA